MANYDLVHSFCRRFLILATAGTSFVPVFSSGQFVSIRGTENPSCIQSLKPPSNHRRATVWPCDYYIHIHTYIDVCMDLNLHFHLQPLSGSEWNHGSTCRIVGLKIKGFKGEWKSYKKKKSLMILRRILAKGHYRLASFKLLVAIVLKAFSNFFSNSYYK